MEEQVFKICASKLINVLEMRPKDTDAPTWKT